MESQIKPTLYPLRLPPVVAEVLDVAVVVADGVVHALALAHVLGVHVLALVEADEQRFALFWSLSLPA